MEINNKKLNLKAIISKKGLVIIQGGLILLKLTGIINLSWLQVLLPTIIPATIFTASFIASITYACIKQQLNKKKESNIKLKEEEKVKSENLVKSKEKDTPIIDFQKVKNDINSEKYSLPKVNGYDQLIDDVLADNTLERGEKDLILRNMKKDLARQKGEIIETEFVKGKVINL